MTPFHNVLGYHVGAWGCLLSGPRDVTFPSSAKSISIRQSLSVVIMASPKKSPTKKARKPKKVATHPPVAQMVNAAIAALKERKGSSLASIKKYIAANYRCDVQKLAPFIRRYVKKAVTEGKLVQKSGTGASGSFRLGAAAKKVKKAKKPKKAKKAKKPKKAKKAKKPKKAKKAKKPKKAKKAKKPKAAKAKKPKAKKAKKAEPRTVKKKKQR